MVCMFLRPWLKHDARDAALRPEADLLATSKYFYSCPWVLAYWVGVGYHIIIYITGSRDYHGH